MKTVFLSDIHIGCKHTKAEEVVDFLKHTDADKIYLVGDIVDGWRLKKKFYWNERFNRFAKHLLNHTHKRGVEVYYITGNHDEFLREYSPLHFGNFHLVDETIYESAGKRYLVIHGDLFDVFMTKAKWLTYFGEIGYNAMMWWSHHLKRFQAWCGRRRPWSLAKHLKDKAKQVSTFISDFYDGAIRYTKEKGCDGIICGHIHMPAFELVDGVEYWNCGDWVDVGSYIVDDEQGMRIQNYELAS